MEPTTLRLEIPPEVLAAVKLPPAEVEQELRQELALALYQRGLVGIGPARRLAQLTRWEFEDLLGRRQIPRHYTDRELDEDLDYALGDQ